MEENKILNDHSVQPISQILSGKEIAIVCGGGIAAIEMPRVARELRRHGATVRFFVTQKCLEFVGMTSLEWSSQNSVTIESSGLSEHICTSDAVLVAPATANILSQARYGLCSNSATTLLQSAFGKKIPVGFVPTMHHSMWDSPIIQDNCATLKTLQNVFFLDARREEHKEKIPSPKTLALTFAHYVNKILNKNTKSVLISFGGTRVMIDSVRCLSNLSTGHMGWETVKLFYGMGYSVTAAVGQVNFEIEHMQDITLHQHENYADMYDFFQNSDFSSIDGLFHFLAASDFILEKAQKAKIKSTQENLVLSLQKAKKIRDLKNIQRIPYKFLCKLTEKHDIKSKMNIKKFMNLYNIQSLLWNTVDGAWNTSNIHRGFFVTRLNDDLLFNSVAGKVQIAEKIYEDFK